MPTPTEAALDQVARARLQRFAEALLLSRQLIDTISDYNQACNELLAQEPWLVERLDLVALRADEEETKQIIAGIQDNGERIAMYGLGVVDEELIAQQQEWNDRLDSIAQRASICYGAAT